MQPLFGLSLILFVLGNVHVVVCHVFDLGPNSRHAFHNLSLAHAVGPPDPRNVVLLVPEHAPRPIDHLHALWHLDSEVVLDLLEHASGTNLDLLQLNHCWMLKRPHFLNVQDVRFGALLSIVLAILLLLVRRST